MSVLTVTDLSEETLAALARRAAAHGVSVEDEARNIISTAVPTLPKFTAEENRAFMEHLLSFPDISDEDAWMFDRHDPRNARPVKPPLDLSD